MVRIIPVLLALLLASPAAGQTLSPDDLKRAITEKTEQLQAELMALVDRMTAAPPITDLQAALDAGGLVTLPKAGTFTGPRFIISKSGTQVRCNGATVTGMTGPAFWIQPDVDDVTIDADCVATSGWNGAVVQCGDNDRATQGTAARVPQRITIRNLTIPTHRGKRGIEWNCAGRIENPQIADVYSGELNPQDSQAINILNTCGPVAIVGGTLVAGSENLLIGGDTLKITDCPKGVVYDVLVDDVTLTKPDAWRVAATRVAPKNVVELKAGEKIVVRHSRIGGSYRGTSAGGATQDGSCVVITPRNGQRIADVLFEDNTIDRCAQGVQLMGRDVVTTPLTTGVVFRGNRWTVDGLTYNGRGILALVVGGMPAVRWENETVLQSGSSLFLVDSTEPVGPFTITGSRMTTGKIVCSAPGVNYCGPTPAGRVPFTLTAEGNTFADAPAQFKALYPSNTWITRAALELAIATPAK